MNKQFEMVKDFYNCQLWSEYMVKNAVDRWITADEFLEITGKEYEKKE
ncbi:XkdX family protein [Clostridium sp. E02]|nr:XkdX family protein [Clostridium sp. E02]